ncbi:deoxycytidine triphosphate deaminase [Xanthomonas phaseoli pv. syngonii LMG 9055]|uniref:Deoxycytidine triphosphate deaminase n=1 Tax=Xanthomonas phaseoli pv. syngonii LMG 9055 TaxID=1437878 RepID=A0A1V9HHN8_9XANT|nr:deoxycytidine triphosphate deaminase [Xanthomonas phaseoli pv. syngonii LMG 9055]
MTDTTLRTDPSTTSIEAAAFRRLLQHLNQDRTDVQNIDLMILAGFCRNCLGDWYREAAEAQGQTMTKEQAREAVYGMPFAQWKQQHQKDATPEQLEAFAAAQRKHGQ